MSLLGFDTSTAATSACVLRPDGEAFELVPATAALFDGPAHSRELMPAIADCMARAELGWGDIEAVAVGVGPGAFTGLRIGVATARGLAAARGLELRPVSSLAALAEGIDAPLRLAAIDARRGQVFAALWGEGPEPLWGPLALGPEELARRVREGGQAPRAAGDGAVLLRDVLEEAGAVVEADDSPAHVVRGRHVCRLGRTAPARPPQATLPDYQRLPDATPR